MDGVEVGDAGSVDGSDDGGGGDTTSETQADSNIINVISKASSRTLTEPPSQVKLPLPEEGNDSSLLLSPLNPVVKNTTLDQD